MDLFFKILAAIFGLGSVSAAIYNVLTGQRNAKQRDEANRQASQIEATLLLATRTEQRVNALEGRVGSIEQRIERRMDQMGSDITKVKDLFTDFLINQKH
jgi:hypothetical protein